MKRVKSKREQKSVSFNFVKFLLIISTLFANLLAFFILGVESNFSSDRIRFTPLLLDSGISPYLLYDAITLETTECGYLYSLEMWL